MKDFLETNRLILRKWTDEDSNRLYELASDPEVGMGAGWPAHTDPNYSKAIIRTILSADGEYAITIKENACILVGSIGFRVGKSKSRGLDREDDAEVGYWVGKDYWNRGIATEALLEIIRYGFEETSVSRIWCGYFDGNDRSKRVMEKCGMRFSHRNEKLYNAMLKSYYNESMMFIDIDGYKNKR